MDDQVVFFEDLKDALKWLFVGAVVWEAAKGKQPCPNQDALGMFTTFVQARALYDFYYKEERDSDDARAEDFCDATWEPPKSTLYLRYVAKGSPLNKRVFHLVYGRSGKKCARASGPSGPGHLKEQVIEFAKDLLQVTKTFVQCARQEYKDLAQSALDAAYRDAQEAAGDLEIPIPF
jgi:hypothetical protein